MRGPLTARNARGRTAMCVHCASIGSDTSQHRPARPSTGADGENGTTSIEQYSLALRSTKEKIIPPPLNQRVRGSSPYLCTPPHAPDPVSSRHGQRHLDTRPVVYPSYVHRSATGLPAPASSPADQRRSSPDTGPLAGPVIIDVERTCGAAARPHSGASSGRRLRSEGSPPTVLCQPSP